MYAHPNLCTPEKWPGEVTITGVRWCSEYSKRQETSPSPTGSMHIGKTACSVSRFFKASLPDVRVHIFVAPDSQSCLGPSGWNLKRPPSENVNENENY